MNNPSRKMLWFIIVFLTVVIWIQIFASWNKDAYIAKLDDCTDSLIDENRKIKNDLNELNEKLLEANLDLELIRRKITK